MTKGAKLKAIAFINAMDFEPTGGSYELFETAFNRVDNVWLRQEELQGRTFQDIQIFVFQVAENDDSYFHEMQILRNRFPNRKYVLEWHGSKKQGRITSQILDAKLFQATHDAIDDEAALLAMVKSVVNERRESVQNPIIVENSSLVSRIENVADAVADLRLNSTGHIVEELRKIAKELRGPVGAVIPNEILVDPRSRLKRALLEISAIFDAIESNRTASMIVAGCVAALVGNCGWSSTACFSLSMASWFGKDAFLVAVSKLPSVDSSTKPLLNYGKKSPPRT